MVKILMVCLGNICRSPLAEGILRSKVNDKKVLIESAGTGGWHIGEQPDTRSIEIAYKHNIDISDQRCRKFIYSDFEEFDLIYVMDRSNLYDVLQLAKNEQDKLKVQLVLDGIFNNRSNEVPDPYYGGETGFENVYQMLDDACQVIANKFNDEH